MSVQKPDFNYTGHGWEGMNYQKCKDMSTVEIAKLIRAEIKYKFPQYKISVSSEYFSGGSAIRIYFKGGLDTSIFTPEFIKWAQGDQCAPMERGQHEYNERFSQLLKQIEAIAKKYNFDDSDGQIDYFHTNFYLRTGVWWEYNSQLRDQAKALASMVHQI